MKGDYYRYISEYAQNQQKDDVIKGADESYSEAAKLAESLKTTHPIRLGLALN